MAERTHPWRPKPPQNVLDLLQRVGTTRLYLVQRMGPASFIVREEGSEIKRRVLIGSEPSCSCWPPGNGREPCIHILFVLVKVLRVPPDNPLVWQLSLSDRELEEVLACSALPSQAPVDARQRQQPKTLSQDAEEGGVKRKALDEEDVCPICYEDIAATALPWLVWCRHGCGNNIHGKCMGVWADHQTRSLGKTLTCPFCRTDWGEFKWKPPPRPRKVKQARTDVHYGCRCGACRNGPLTGSRFRCLVCNDFNLCSACFATGTHPQHPFACRELPGGPEVAATRPGMIPGMMPSVVQLRPPSERTQHTRTNSSSTNATSSDEEAGDSEGESAATASSAGRRRSIEAERDQEQWRQLGRSRSVGAERSQPAAAGALPAAASWPGAPSGPPRQAPAAGTAAAAAAARLSSHPVEILWHDGLEEPLQDAESYDATIQLAPGWLHAEAGRVGVDPGPSFTNFTNTLAEPGCVHSGGHRRSPSGPSSSHFTAAFAAGGGSSQRFDERTGAGDAQAGVAGPARAGQCAAAAGEREGTSADQAETPSSSHFSPAFSPAGDAGPVRSAAAAAPHRRTSRCASDSTAGPPPSLLQPGPSSMHFGGAFADGAGRRHSSAPRAAGRPVQPAHGRAARGEPPQAATLDRGSALLCGVGLAHPERPQCAAPPAAGDGGGALLAAPSAPAPAHASSTATGTAASSGTGSSTAASTAAKGAAGPGRCSSAPRQRSSAGGATVGAATKDGSRPPRGRQSVLAAAATAAPPQLLLSVLSCQSGGSVQQEAPVEAEERVGRTLSCPQLCHGSTPAVCTARRAHAADAAPEAGGASQRRHARPRRASRSQDDAGGAASGPVGGDAVQLAVDGFGSRRSTADEGEPPVHSAQATGTAAGAESAAATGGSGAEGWGVAGAEPAVMTGGSGAEDWSMAGADQPADPALGDSAEPREEGPWGSSTEVSGVVRMDSLGVDSQGSSFSLPEHVDVSALKLAIERASSSDLPPGGVWLSRQRCRVAPEGSEAAPLGSGTPMVVEPSGSDSQGSSFTLPEHVDAAVLQAVLASTGAAPIANGSWLPRQRLRVAPETDIPGVAGGGSAFRATALSAAGTDVPSPGCIINLPEHHTDAAAAAAATSAETPASGGGCGWLSRQRLRVTPEAGGQPSSPSPDTPHSASGSGVTGTAAGTESQSSSFSLPEHVDIAALNSVPASELGGGGAALLHGLPSILPRARMRLLPALPSCKAAAGEGQHARLPSLRQRRNSRVEPVELGTRALLDIPLLTGKEVAASHAALRRSPSAPASRLLLHGGAEMRGMPQGCAPAAAAAMAARGRLDSDGGESPDWKTFSNPAYNRPYCADLPAP